jgi:hypothetical protein
MVVVFRRRNKVSSVSKDQYSTFDSEREDEQTLDLEKINFSLPPQIYINSCTITTLFIRDSDKPN